MSSNDPEYMLNYALKVMAESSRNKQVNRGCQRVQKAREALQKETEVSFHQKKRKVSRQVGYISPGGMIKMEKGWKKATKADLLRRQYEKDNSV